ncbi:hypothetical protein NLI96_g9896 [Meripilus lineatus]|uniref:Uncharacterized protein n=1 Tax=Meripilus lineatus TaxID=2056292 RepID=A0AAD5Y9S0_9APHY|nr:hypothetical protein NLI96_g9896 [Physisporinus lineatus]
MFNPTQPHLLDVNVPITTLSLRTSRTPSEGASTPMKQAETNQKTKFDIDVSGKWLAKGDQDGQISAFDLTSEAGHHILTGVEPDLIFQAHEDAIGSVGFHPIRPLLLSVSGSRHFHGDHDSSDSTDSEGEHEDLQTNVQENQTAEPCVRPRAIRNPLGRIGFTSHDNSAKLWDFTFDRYGGLYEINKSCGAGLEYTPERFGTAM